MAITIELNVDPEALKQKTVEIRALLVELEKNLIHLKGLMEDSSAYWKGKAGDAYRKKYEDNLSKINGVLERHKEYPDKILKMAGIYEDVELENLSYVNSLTDDLGFV